MTEQKTRDMTRHQEPAAPDGDPFVEGAGDLRQQAATYADIARAAHADCQQLDAEHELQRRRNQSGQ